MPSLRQHLPIVAFGWFLAAALQIALSAVVPAAALRDRPLGTFGRLALAGWECLALALATLAIAVPILVLAALANRRPRLRPLAAFVSFAILASATLVWCASWVAFWVGGRFLDPAALRFHLDNAGIVLGYAVESYPIALRVLPAAVVAFVAAAVQVLPRFAARMGAQARHRVGLASASALIAAILAVLGGEVVRVTHQHDVVDAQTGESLHYSRYFDVRRKFRTGPLTHAFLGLDAESGLFDDPVLHVRAVAEAPARRLRSAAEHAAPSGGKAPSPFDVVLVLVDSMRPDQLAAYGASRRVMPHLDAIATQSRVYLDAYSNGSATDLAAPCPLTSHYPLRIRKEYGLGEVAAYPRVMLHDLLHAYGYRTAIAVSNNEFWGDTIHLLWSPRLDLYFTAGLRVPAQGPASVRPIAPHVDDARTIDVATAWIQSLPEQPLFLYVNLQNAHIPYVVPQGFPRPFGGRGDLEPRMGPLTQERARLLLDAYADALHYVDHQIGRLVLALQQAGRWERTILVVSADHGQAFGEHGVGGHSGYPWDEVMRVPLLVRAPGLEPGLDTTPAESIDIAPTITGLLGLPKHPSFQGSDLRDPSLPQERDRFLLSLTPIARAYAVVRGRHKLIFDAEQGRFALFDLAADPGERQDLAAREPATVRRLAERLEGWRRAQTRYYMDRERWRNEYPPLLAAAESAGD